MKYTEEQIKDIFEQECLKFGNIAYGKGSNTEKAMLRTVKRIMSATIEKECTNCGHLFSGEGEYCPICNSEE